MTCGGDCQNGLACVNLWEETRSKNEGKGQGELKLRRSKRREGTRVGDNGGFS